MFACCYELNLNEFINNSRRGTLTIYKKEEIYFRKYQTLKEVINNVPKFIEEVYNKKRLHSSLGYMSPEEYECKILKLKKADRPVQRISSQRV